MAVFGCPCSACNRQREAVASARFGPYAEQKQAKVLYDAAMASQAAAYANATTKVVDRDVALAERAERLASRWGPHPDPLTRIEVALDKLEACLG